MFTIKRVSVVEGKRRSLISSMTERVQIESSLTIKRVSGVNEKRAIRYASTTKQAQVEKATNFIQSTSKFAYVLCMIILMNALPTVVRSFDEDPLMDTTASTTSSPEVVPVLNEMPYPTEPLLGDAVIGDFVVGPGKIEIEIKPGETKVVEMTVSNRTGAPRIFEMLTEDAEGSNDPSQSLILLGDDTGPYSLKEYISVPVTRFELGHNERARIPVTISIPADAEPGGLYGSMLVSTVTNEAKPGNTAGTAPQSAVVARIGTLFFITIPGAIEKDGSLQELTTIPNKKFYQNGPINFGLLYENRGSIHLAPYGEIRITNMFNEEVGYQEIDPWFVLPKSLRLREVSWNRDFLFGKYTATVYINRSYDDVIDEMSYTFWVLPWKPVAGVFAVLFLVFFSIRAFFKNFEFKRK